MAKTSRISRLSRRHRDGAIFSFTFRAKAAGEYSLSCRKANGRTAGRSFGPQRLSSGEPELLPSCVEQISLIEDPNRATTKYIRIDFGPGRGSCRRVARNCQFRVREAL